MKKVLFATTALVASAGMAAADVSFGGLARFGVLYVEGAAQETRIESRFRLNVTGTATADNGLEFSARVRAQADDTGGGGATTTMWNGANFGVAYGGLSVQVGNISGAIDSQAGMYSQSLGLSGLGWHNVVANSNQAGDFFGFDTYTSTGAGRNGVRLAYTMGDFSAVASYSDLGGLERTAVSAAYTFNNWTVSLGWQDSSNNVQDDLHLIISGDVGPAALTLKVGQNDDNTKFVIGGDFEVGAATTISAFYSADEDVMVAGNMENGDSYGIGFVHNLGGGTSIRGGVVEQWNKVTTADLGLQFNF